MQTEDIVQDKKKELIENKKKFLIDIIAASARYERLLSNKDFIDIMKDLTNVVSMHDNEIKGYLSVYSMSSSFFKKMRLAEVMSQHQLKRDQIQEAINYPQNIVQQASIAREELDKLKQQEKENENDGSN
jgi:hypothetical protein